MEEEKTWEAAVNYEYKYFELSHAIGELNGVESWPYGSDIRYSEPKLVHSWIITGGFLA